MKNINPYWFLGAGIITIALAHLAVSIDLAGWIAAVPFLIFLQKTKGVTSRLLFVLALIIAWSVGISKIVSPPMPFAMVFLYSVPISIIQLPGFLIWDKYKDRSGALMLFPAIMTLMEWIQYTYTPLASWGVAAYTQQHTLPMMQVLSLFGMTGLSFIVYWVNVSLSEIFVGKKRNSLNLQLPAIVVTSVFTFGGLRIELSKMREKDQITVAAIGSDSEVQGFPLPSAEVKNVVIRNLIERTIHASRNGAKLIVWNEAATFVYSEDESEWIDSLSALAKQLKVAVVAAYIVPTSEAPPHYENKYSFFDPTGTLVYTYHKHQPVPGEPADNGTEEFKVINVGEAKIGAAICYDYDFPYIAQGFGMLDADIVAVPSSDWRGIDPLHTNMAAFRAVEQGHSILRSTRFGLSAAITPYGEMTATMSSYDNNDKIMIAHLPLKKTATLYSVIGDTFIYACMVFIAVYFFVLFLKRNSVEYTELNTLKL